MNDRIMLRPFQDYIGREQHLDMVQVRGELSGSQFVIAVFGQEVRLEVPEAGEDERGTFALVAPFEVALRDGFRMRLEAEYDEYLPPGAKLAVFLPKDAREAVPGEPQPSVPAHALRWASVRVLRWASSCEQCVMPIAA